MGSLFPFLSCRAKGRGGTVTPESGIGEVFQSGSRQQVCYRALHNLLENLAFSFPVYHQQNVFGCGDISEANGKAACEFWGAVKIFLPHLLCSAVKLCKMHGKGEIHTRLIERQMAVHTHPQQDKIQASGLCYAAADRFAFGL